MYIHRTQTIQIAISKIRREYLLMILTLLIHVKYMVINSNPVKISRL
jgi:hypothetical protein